MKEMEMTSTHTQLLGASKNAHVEIGKIIDSLVLMPSLWADIDMRELVAWRVKDTQQGHGKISIMLHLLPLETFNTGHRQIGGFRETH
jgi:hypothetical protein